MNKQMLSTINIDSTNGYHKNIENTKGYLLAVIGDGEDNGEDKLRAFGGMNDTDACCRLLAGAIVAAVDIMHSNGVNTDAIYTAISQAIETAGTVAKERMERCDHGNETLH